MKLLKSIPLALLGLVCTKNYAQEFKADLQIRPRFEYTNGFGTLLTPTTEQTSFIGNRTRLNLNYGDDKLKMKVALQNVRTWGAVNNLQGGLSGQANDFIMFEGWAEYSFTKKFSTKIGRQPLSYDNQRILGGLDWANQGRSFDAALLKFKGAKSQLDLGFSLSSADELKTSASYPAAVAFGVNDNAYKSLQYAWFHTAIEKVGVSLLAVNLGREYIKSVAEKDLETNYYQTFGTFVDYKGKKLAIDFSLYGQTGKIGAQNVSAYQTSANIGYAFSPKFKATAGYELLSGKDNIGGGVDVKSFNPIFGTNHAFNGYMDYFYVGNYNGNVGLQDLYLKLEFPIKKLNVSITPHAFKTAAKFKNGAGEDMTSDLGTELDITAAYKLSKDIMIIGGYSQMFATETMVAVKSVDKPTPTIGGLNGATNNWAWLMININPQIFSSSK